MDAGVLQGGKGPYELTGARAWSKFQYGSTSEMYVGFWKSGEKLWKIGGLAFFSWLIVGIYLFYCYFYVYVPQKDAFQRPRCHDMFYWIASKYGLFLNRPLEVKANLYLYPGQSV